MFFFSAERLSSDFDRLGLFSRARQRWWWRRTSNNLGSHTDQPQPGADEDVDEDDDPTHDRVVVGELIVLDCLASGYPPPAYSWYKDGGRLSPAHDRSNLCQFLKLKIPTLPMLPTIPMIPMSRFNLAPNGSLMIDNAQLDDRLKSSFHNFSQKYKSVSLVPTSSS